MHEGFRELPGASVSGSGYNPPMYALRFCLVLVSVTGLVACGGEPKSEQDTDEQTPTCELDTDDTDDTVDGTEDTSEDEDNEDTGDCPGGQGESLCCQENESFCGTSVSSFGEDCCVQGEVCEQCWSPDDEDYAGLCIGERGMCPDEPPPE